MTFVMMVLRFSTRTSKELIHIFSSVTFLLSSALNKSILGWIHAKKQISVISFTVTK